MAYVNQEMKKELAPGIKAVLTKYGMKGTIAIRNGYTLIVNIKQGDLDLLGAAQKHVDLENQRRGMKYCGDIGEYLQVNDRYAAKWAREVGEDIIADFYDELTAAMKGKTYRGEWYNNTDIMTDYFDIAYYIDINVGQWDKGYIYTGEEAIAA